MEDGNYRVAADSIPSLLHLLRSWFILGQNHKARKVANAPTHIMKCFALIFFSLDRLKLVLSLIRLNRTFCYLDIYLILGEPMFVLTCSYLLIYTTNEVCTSLNVYSCILHGQLLKSIFNLDLKENNNVLNEMVIKYI